MQILRQSYQAYWLASGLRLIRKYLDGLCSSCSQTRTSTLQTSMSIKYLDGQIISQLRSTLALTSSSANCKWSNYVTSRVILRAAAKIRDLLIQHIGICRSSCFQKIDNTDVVNFQKIIYGQYLRLPHQVNFSSRIKQFLQMIKQKSKILLQKLVNCLIQKQNKKADQQGTNQKQLSQYLLSQNHSYQLKKVDRGAQPVLRIEENQTQSDTGMNINMVYVEGQLKKRNYFSKKNSKFYQQQNHKPKFLTYQDEYLEDQQRKQYDRKRDEGFKSTRFMQSIVSVSQQKIEPNKQEWSTRQQISNTFYNQDQFIQDANMQRQGELNKVTKSLNDLSRIYIFNKKQRKTFSAREITCVFRRSIKNANFTYARKNQKYDSIKEQEHEQPLTIYQYQEANPKSTSPFAINEQTASKNNKEMKRKSQRRKGIIITSSKFIHVSPQKAMNIRSIKQVKRREIRFNRGGLLSTAIYDGKILLQMMSPLKLK